jgi:hypothetical protein
MRIFLTASKDTTLYQRYPTNNAGLDEILEVGKVAKSEDLGIAYSGSSARILLDFNLSNSGSWGVVANAKYYLNLKIANATKLPYSQEILIEKISTPWTEGSGYFVQQTKNAGDGATWRQSNTNVSWSVYGGDFYNTQSTSVILNEYPLQDLRIDVTDIVGTVVNDPFLDWNGLLIQFPTSSETDYTNQGNIKFFSKQTHTVHQPTLEIAWDSATFITGSVLKQIPNTNDIHIAIKNPRETYVRGTKEKVRLLVRDKYPPKAFDAMLRYKAKYYLPSASYFSIIDTQAGTTIFPDDVYGKISCDATSSYFVLDTSPLYKNRYYTVNLRINNGEYDEVIVPDTFTFLVK